MDPSACLERMIDAIRSADWSEAADAAEDLAYWLDKGGFPPTDSDGRQWGLDEARSIARFVRSIASDE